MWEKRKRRAVTRACQTPGKPVFACKEQKPGWTGKMPIYILVCPQCRAISETHPAGYGRIHCSNPECGFVVRVMTWQRVRDKMLRPFSRGAVFIGTAALAAAAIYALV